MAERGRRFEENLRRSGDSGRRILSIWSGRILNSMAPLALKPLQKPSPPFWIGANADVAIKRAARMSDADYQPS